MRKNWFQLRLIVWTKMAPIRRREFGRLADLPMKGSQYTVEACIMLDPSTAQNLFKGAEEGIQTTKGEIQMTAPPALSTVKPVEGKRYDEEAIHSCTDKLKDFESLLEYLHTTHDGTHIQQLA